MPSLRLPIVGEAAPAGSRPAWRSLAEREGAERAAGEFPPGAAEAPAAMSRRGFLQLLGASAAFAGLSACNPPREQILPYVRRPEEVAPGIPNHYATALSLDGHAVGVVVTSWDGRPAKIEGNPAHPTSLGGVGTLEQAMLLELYDPNRIRGIRRRGEGLAIRGFLAEVSRLAAEHAANGGARLRFLMTPSASPTVGELRRRIQARFPRARFRSWAPLSEAAAREGARIAFGRPLEAMLQLDRARVVLALDADLLEGWGEGLRTSRGFAARRDPGPRMSRLYVAEAQLSVTGGAADHRIRMRPSEVLPFARAVAAHLAELGAADLRPLGAAAPPGGTLAQRAELVARDLWSARGEALVAAGPRQPPALHALAHAMNAALGAVGATVTYRPTVLHDAGDGPGELRDLAAEIQASQVDALVVTAWNPVYAGPADLDLGPLLERVPDVLYHALREDETARRSSWVVGASHPLESWGDARARDGTASIVQPLIAPLYDTVSEVDLLASFLDEGARGAHALVQDTWRQRVAPGSFEGAWRSWLSQGVVPGTATVEESPRLRWDAVASALRSVPPPAQGLEVSFVPEKLHDGRFADNAWLQELPHPIAKITWDNAAYVSPATARRLALEDGDVVTLNLRGREVEAPAWILPGHADDVVTLPLGYGRQVAGPVGRRVGFDAYRLRGGDAPWFAGGLALARTRRRRKLAVTQGHFSIEGRPIAFDYTLPEWREHGAAELEEQRGPLPTIHEPVDYEKLTYKWGMAVDLGRCTGCSACVVACQEENNIPVVGREQVAKGREMHWLRIDRYFSGSADDPQVVAEPVACVHCEAAPCEYVCPVNATVHSDEGLNEMVYNRCVGTRYCSNNCPYKVRRFNYLDFRGHMTPTERMLMNPDVTVRTRGVMEKCTYCVQRIERARITSREQGRNIREGEFTAACAQACPTQAIVFGNLNDPASRVAQLHRDPRRFDLLHELGTRPRTAHLARVRNPNPSWT